jgi:hypothetical protein
MLLYANAGTRVLAALLLFFTCILMLRVCELFLRLSLRLFIDTARRLVRLAHISRLYQLRSTRVRLRAGVGGVGWCVLCVVLGVYCRRSWLIRFVAGYNQQYPSDTDVGVYVVI